LFKETMKSDKPRYVIIGIAGAGLTAIAIITVGLLLWCTSYQASITDAAEIMSITVEIPLITIRSENLAKVEVWAIPTGTGVAEFDYEKWGDAALKDTAQDGTQTWTFGIPKDPVLTVKIFARGYDAAGSKVGDSSLSETGATAIYNAFWGDENADRFRAHVP
jgi:hypothetical protein